MFELLLVIAGLAIGLVVGYQVGQVAMVLKLRQLAMSGQFDQLAKANPLPDVKQLFIERVDTVLYLYEKELGSFICQAATVEELAKLAKEYKNIQYASVMDAHTNSIILFVDGKVDSQLAVDKNES